MVSINGHAIRYLLIAVMGLVLAVGAIVGCSEEGEPTRAPSPVADTPTPTAVRPAFNPTKTPVPPEIVIVTATPLREPVLADDALTRRCGESDSNVGAAAYLYAFAYAHAVSYLDAVADIDGRSSDRYSDSVGDLYLDANGIVDADGDWNEHANSHGDRCTD